MMPKIATLAAAFLALLSVYPSARLSSQALHVPYQTFTLPNGLQVLLHEDHSVPLVSVNMWYHVGSSDEKPGRTGFAHLFEHIMFMGSQHVPTGAFDRLLEAAGGDNNGSTTEDRTNYYEDAPGNALPLPLWLDSYRMGFLLPEITAEKVDLQRGVVQNERRQSYENRPYGLAEENILQRLYAPDHPYHWPVIGSMADLSAATLDDVRGFFRTYYTPNNATLAIAGDITPRATRQLVERYFGDIPRGPAVTRPTPPAVQLGADVYATLEDRVQVPRVYDAWHSMKAFADGDATLDVLANVLAGGRSSRLYKRLVYELQIATDVVAFQDGGRIDGKCEPWATAPPGPGLLGATRLAAQAVDRAKPPALPPPPALKLPAVQTAALANGLELAVVEMHKVPVVDVQLVLDAGAARDPVDLPGLATFTATMLQQGAGRRGALEIADEAAFLGSQLNTAASYDAATVSLHVPKRRLEPARDLLADLVLRPTFAVAE